MAVDLVSTPDPFALTKGGRIRFRFTGSGRVVSAGSFATNAVNFPGSLPVTDGTRFPFRWNGRNVVVIARTNPSEVNEIPTGNGSGAYVASLLPFFQEYFPFREDFTVSLDSMGGSHSLIFDAKKPGPLYNFNAADTQPNIGNIDPRFKAADPLTRDRYSVYLELHRQKAGTMGTTVDDFERVYVTSIETDNEGVADFDAGEILHAELSADLPAWNAALASEAIQSHRLYFISYGEAWGSPLQVGRVVNSDLFHAYLGGADYSRKAGAGFDLGSFLAGPTAAEDRALRLGLSTRYTYAAEPQFLSFLNTRATIEATLQLQLIFDDGTTLSVPAAVPAFRFKTGDKWTIPVGVTQLALLEKVPAGRALSQYTVRLTSAGANQPLSAEYRFILFGGYEPYLRHFSYLSSLGVIDTLTTHGKGSQELNRFYEQAERYLPSAYHAADGQFVDYDVAVQQQVEVATGFRSKADLQGWTDFYRSPLRFRMRRPGAAWEVLPVGLISKSIKQAKDGDTLFAHKFEYAYLYRDDFYSADDDADRQGDGVPPPNLNPIGSAPIVINQPVITPTVDKTIDDAVRNLTAADILKFKTAAARPNPETLGFLTQAAGAQLFRGKNARIGYEELINTPTTRDEAGLLDVPTKDEVAALSAIHSLDDTVRYGGAVTNLPISTGGYIRDTAPVAIPRALGVAAWSDNAPNSKALEMMLPYALREFMSLVPLALSLMENGQALVVRKDANGTLDIVSVNRDNLDAVVRRGPVTDAPMVTGGYGRVSKPTELGYANNVASWVQDPGSGYWYLEIRSTPAFMNDVLGVINSRAWAERLAPELSLLLGSSSRLVTVTEVRCRKVTVTVDETPTRRIDLVSVKVGQTFSHPYADPANLFTEIYDTPANGGRRNDAIGVDTSTPYKLTITSIPPNLSPYSGRIRLIYDQV